MTPSRPPRAVSLWMSAPHADRSIAVSARAAGWLYLVVIVLGLTSELMLRHPLQGAAAGLDLFDALHGAEGVLRLSIAADLVMVTCDVALAVLLFRLLRSAGAWLALTAMTLRLVQAAVVAANLMNLQTAWLLVAGAPGLAGLPAAQAGALAAHFLALHGQGYDLGLALFGACSMVTARLIWTSRLVARPVGVGIAAAGIVYVTGSALRLAAPALYDAFAIAYLIPVMAETALCLALLRVRMGPADTGRLAASSPLRTRDGGRVGSFRPDGVDQP